MFNGRLLLFSEDMGSRWGYPEPRQGAESPALLLELCCVDTEPSP